MELFIVTYNCVYLFPNRIIYIHMMAHNQMHTQIRLQTAAFAKGFHSLFNKEILSFFSVPEVSRRKNLPLFYFLDVH